MDADDTWAHNKLEKQINAILECKDIVWCGCNGWHLNKRTRVKSPLFDTSIAYTLMTENAIGCLDAAPKGLLWVRSTLLLRKDVFDQVGGFMEGVSAAEDMDLFLKIAYIYGRMGYVNEQLVNFSVYNKNSLSSADFSVQISQMTKIAYKHLRKTTHIKQLQKLFLPRMKHWIKFLCKNNQKIKAVKLYLIFFKYFDTKSRYELLKFFLLRL